MTEARRLSAALGLGLGAGVLTALLQGVLDFPWLALVNAAAPWLTVSYVAGSLQSSPARAALAGAATSLVELVGYYGTAQVAGHAVSTRNIAFWAVCGLIGGPVLGAGGWLWQHASGRLVGIGPALLAAAWLAEATVSYAITLHYTTSAVLFAAIGIAVLLLTAWHGRQVRRALAWLVPCFALGCAAFALVGVLALRG